MRVRVFPELAGDRPHVGFLCIAGVGQNCGPILAMEATLPPQ